MRIRRAIVRGALAGAKAKKAGGDARAVTKAAVSGAGVPGMDKAIDSGFDKAPDIIEAARAKAPAIVSRAESMAQGLADRFTKPTPIAPPPSPVDLGMPGYPGAKPKRNE